MMNEFQVNQNQANQNQKAIFRTFGSLDGEAKG